MVESSAEFMLTNYFNVLFLFVCAFVLFLSDAAVGGSSHAVTKNFDTQTLS